jgi:hypothetical protein
MNRDQSATDLGRPSRKASFQYSQYSQYSRRLSAGGGRSQEMLTIAPETNPDGRRTRAARTARARRWLALGFAAAGVGMLPWLAYLAVSLPSTAVAWHWRAAWTGLDAMEAAGLLSTGILLRRRDPRACLTAAATAALLLADAWFDVTTAPPGSGVLTSLLMAVVAEFPAAAVCITVAVRGLRGLSQSDGLSGGPAARGGSTGPAAASATDRRPRRSSCPPGSRSAAMVRCDGARPAMSSRRAGRPKLSSCPLGSYRGAAHGRASAPAASR